MNQPAMDNDVELVRSMGAGDRQAFSRFYDLYSRLLFALALRILNDQQEAEEVLREVFVQIWDQARSYHSGLGPPRTWVVTLTRNKAVDYLHAYQSRKKFHEQVTGEMVVRSPGEPTANESIRRREAAERIATALADLPEDQRKAIEVTFFSGLTQPQMAETLKESPASIKARIRSGLLALRGRLEGVA